LLHDNTAAAVSDAIVAGPGDHRKPHLPAAASGTESFAESSFAESDPVRRAGRADHSTAGPARAAPAHRAGVTAADSGRRTAAPNGNAGQTAGVPQLGDGGDVGDRGDGGGRDRSQE
jgi:hypothetical protein